MPTSSTSTRSTCPARPPSKGASPSSATSWSTEAGRKVALLLALLAAGCRGAAVDPPGAGTSPQANAEPAPLANVATATGTATATTTGADAGPPPEALRSDRALSPDAPHETVRELGGKDTRSDSKELGGYVMQAVVHTGEGPPAPKGPEVNAAAIEAARRKLEARLAVTVSQTRARIVLSGGWLLPQDAELRARVDRYGHVLIVPGEEGYRVVEPGALRALLGERRLDVAPLSPAETTSTGEGARRLNQRTRRVDIATRAAKATFELGTFRDAGDGGGLVCRALLDLVNVPPGASPCQADEIPLHAELRWTTQGALAYDVTNIVRRIDLPAQELAAPPATTAFASTPLPGSWGEPLLGKGELAAFRNAPIDPPPPVTRDAQAPPPDAGLVLVNSTDELRVAWLDGVPVAWVAPGGRVPLPSLVRGRYLLQWRTALGDAWEPPEPLTVPVVSELGADAGPK